MLSCRSTSGRPGECCPASSAIWVGSRRSKSTRAGRGVGERAGRRADTGILAAVSIGGPVERMRRRPGRASARRWPPLHRRSQRRSDPATRGRAGRTVDAVSPSAELPPTGRTKFDAAASATRSSSPTTTSRPRCRTSPTTSATRSDCPGSPPCRGVDDRVLRRPLHGRDGQDPQLRQDGADPRRPGRVQPRRHDHRADQLRAWKAEHPGAVVVSYVNTTAAVKAETDICLHVVQRRRRGGVDPRGHRGAVLPRPVPRRPRAARDGPREHAHLARGVPRARRNQRFGPEATGRRGTGRRAVHPPRVRVRHAARSTSSAPAWCPKPAPAILSTSGMVTAAQRHDGRTGARRHRDGDAPPARPRPTRSCCSSPSTGRAVVQVHEDDHAGQAAEGVARGPRRGRPCPSTSPSGRGRRSSE